MSDIDLSLARLAADAEEKRAALEAGNDALEQRLRDAHTEVSLLTEERDSLIYELERERRGHELHHGGQR